MSLGAECHDEHCITCGDVAEEMTVLALDADRGLALCADSTGAHRSVESALVEPVALGDGLLVHAGTAIANLGQAAADAERAEQPERADHLDTPGREAEVAAADHLDTPGREAQEVLSP